MKIFEVLSRPTRNTYNFESDEMYNAINCPIGQATYREIGEELHRNLQLFDSCECEFERADLEEAIAEQESQIAELLAEYGLEMPLDEAPASKELCMSSKPDSELGASNLSSCKSQGFRARNSKVKHTIGGKRRSIKGQKVRGKKYGGPLPDWSSKKSKKK